MNTQPPTLRTIFVFWLPLALTWVMMAVEGPFLAAVIARLAEPIYNLAAFGVAFSFALIIEAPIIMVMAATTALVHDRQSYCAMRRFTFTASALLTAAMVVLLLPPVFDLVAHRLNLPDEVADRTHLGILLLLPWPAAIGIRRFYQGVLIRSGMTRRVAYGTVVRLLSMLATAILLWRFGDVDGASVGAAALSVGVLVEAVAAHRMARRAVTQTLDVQPAPETEPLGQRAILSFYTPLALTTLLGLGLHPVVTFFMGHSRAGLESLAVLPVIMSLVFLFRSLGLAYQEVAIALIGDLGEGYQALRRFAGILGVAVVFGLSLIAWTPLATVWFHDVSGLTTELTGYAILPTRILAIIPGLTVLVSFQRALLVTHRATTHVTWATVLEVVAVVSVLSVGVLLFDIVGVTVAAIALVVGRAAANLYLVPPLRRLRQRGR